MRGILLYGPKYRLYLRGQLLVGEVMATNMTDVKSRDGAFWLPSLKILNFLVLPSFSMWKYSSSSSSSEVNKHCSE